MHATAGKPEVQDSDEKDHVLNKLNLTRGLAGSLIASIVDVVIRDDARNGVNRDEIRQKRIASAKEVLASKRQKYSAGPHAASGQFIVGPDVLDNIEEGEAACAGRQSLRVRGKKAARVSGTPQQGLCYQRNE